MRRRGSKFSQERTEPAISKEVATSIVGVYGKIRKGKEFARQEEIVRFEVFTAGDYEEWCLLGCYAVWLL
jgi:hypothetical protein